MLDNSIRILNFDNSILKQQKLISNYKAKILDLTKFGPKARLWLDKRTEQEILKNISGEPENSIFFLGSGDFHHLSSLLISRFKEPLCVIVFDLHPDWDIFWPKTACGSWVTKILKSKNIAKVILSGISSEDISTWNIQSGNLAALANNRVEIYPYAHGPSLVFGRRIPRNISIDARGRVLFNKIYWSQLMGKDLKDFFLSVVKRIPVKKVYLSIDKDCLKKEYALTNWEEGKLGLEELLDMLKVIRDNLEIAGVDICGDYSEISIEGKIKRFVSKLDHPKNPSADHCDMPAITALNEITNLKILQTIITS